MSAAAVKPPGPTMQPSTPSKPRSAVTRESKAGGGLGFALRVVISIVIAWHFAAIFLAALCIPATSDLVIDITQKPPMQWYLDVLYMNQGHSFFAPDVGPSRIVEYELYDQSGQPIGKDYLPSRKNHWPRLRYHRHFMLADQAPADSEYWGRTFLEAYARQILREHPQAQGVRARLYAHWPLYQDLEVKARNPEYGRERAYQDFMRRMNEQGIKIDARGYELLLEVQQRRSDLGPEAQPDQSSVWHNGPVETAGRWNSGGLR